MEVEAARSQKGVLPLQEGLFPSKNAILPLQTVIDISEPTNSEGISYAELKNFVAVGCIRLPHNKVDEKWACLGKWRDVSTMKEIFSDSVIVESQLLWRIEILLKRGWIRVRFKSNKRDCTRGAIQVYVLPDDGGVYRPPFSSQTLRQSLRRALRIVMMHIDLNPKLWEGDWNDSDEVIPHPSHARGKSPSGENAEQSLFYIFNTLSSPNPEPLIVGDIYSSAAMEAILVSDIPGLKSELYRYQRRSAAMMVQREVLSISTLDPRLVETKTQHFQYYYDPVRAFILCKPQMYEQARGGICAETMGLG